MANETGHGKKWTVYDITSVKWHNDFKCFDSPISLSPTGRLNINGSDFQTDAPRKGD